MKAIRIIFVIGLLAASGFAHKYHTSLTRIDYRAKEKNIEISIRLFVHDVTPMLERRLKKQVDASKSPEVDGELFKYVGENFILRDAADAKIDLKWVGKEFENDVLFVYLEASYDGDPKTMSLENTLFFESYAEQSNLVVGKFGDTKFDLAFRAGDKKKKFSN